MDESPQSSAPALGPEDINKLVSPPAITMLVVTGLSSLAQVIELVFDPADRLIAWIAHTQDVHIGDSGGVLHLAYGLFRLAIAAVVIIGAVKMLQQRSWSLSMAAAILMVVPCLGPCCPIGIPVGVWALIVLLKPEVRQVLERRA